MNQQTPAIAGIMNRLKTEGWGAFENMGQNAAETASRMRDEAEREARIVQACFETEAGQACLEWLIKKTILRGPNQAEIGATTAEHFSLASAKRLGQNLTVFMILQALSYKDQQA
jgi:hypothetical protein